MSERPEPAECPHCHFDFSSVRGTDRDVIGIYGLRLGYLMGYKCPHCGYEWSGIPGQEGQGRVLPLERGYLTRTRNP